MESITLSLGLIPIVLYSAGSAGNITRGTLSKIPFKKIGDTIRNKYGKYS